MRKGFYISLLYFIAVFLIGFLNIYNSPAINLNKYKIFQNVIFTQGWGFFTKNPRDVRTAVYYQGRNIIIPLTRVENLFGIKRGTSRYSYEVGLLVQHFEDHQWHKTSTNNFMGEYYPIKNPLKKGIIKGKILVINEERTPWAWAKFDKQLNYNKIYIKLDVQ